MSMPHIEYVSTIGIKMTEKQLYSNEIRHFVYMYLQYNRGYDNPNWLPIMWFEFASWRFLPEHMNDRTTEEIYQELIMGMVNPGRATHKGDPFEVTQVRVENLFTTNRPDCEKLISINAEQHREELLVSSFAILRLLGQVGVKHTSP